MPERWLSSLSLSLISLTVGGCRGRLASSNPPGPLSRDGRAASRRDAFRCAVLELLASRAGHCRTVQALYRRSRWRGWCLRVAVLLSVVPAYCYFSRDRDPVRCLRAGAAGPPRVIVQTTRVSMDCAVRFCAATRLPVSKVCLRTRRAYRCREKRGMGTMSEGRCLRYLAVATVALGLLSCIDRVRAWVGSSCLCAGAFSPLTLARRNGAFGLSGRRGELIDEAIVLRHLRDPVLASCVELSQTTPDCHL